MDPDFGIWENQEYWALESGIQLKKSGIALTSPGSTDKNWNTVPGIRNPLCRIQNSITWDDFKGKSAEQAQTNLYFRLTILFVFLSGSGAAPSATNILLVAMTVASIMALIGVVYLGRKAIKTVNSPYNYDPVLVN